MYSNHEYIVVFCDGRESILSQGLMFAPPAAVCAGFYLPTRGKKALLRKFPLVQACKPFAKPINWLLLRGDKRVYKSINSCWSGGRLFVTTTTPTSFSLPSR